MNERESCLIKGMFWEKLPWKEDGCVAGSHANVGFRLFPAGHKRQKVFLARKSITIWCVDTGAAVVKWSIYISYQEIFSPHTYSWAFKLTNHLIQTGPSECYWVLAPLSLIIYFGVIQGNCEPVHDVFSSSVWAVLDTTIDIPHVDFIILVKQLNHPRFILLFTYWWKNVVP